MQFRKLEENEIVKVNNLNPIGEKSWRSEFFSKDFQPSYIAACEDGDNLAGCEGYIAYSLIQKGTLRLTHRSERTVIDGKYRGKGLFEKLISTCDQFALNDNSAFSWGATAALKPFKRAGFKGYVGFRSYIFFPIRSNFLKKAFSKIKFINPILVYKVFKAKQIKDIKELLSWLSLFKPIKRNKIQSIEFTDFHYDQVKKLLLNNDQNYFKINPADSLFSWLEKKGLTYTKFLIHFENELIGYIILEKNLKFNYSSIKDIYFKSNTVTIEQILLSLSKVECFSQFTSFFLALNNNNKTHASWIKNLSQAEVINLKKAGSFVIKPLKEKVSISDLLLTDLWLEL